MTQDLDDDPGISPGSRSQGLHAAQRSSPLTFKATAAAIVGHVRMKRMKGAGGVECARTELSFKRPDAKIGSEETTVLRSLLKRQGTMGKSLPKFGDIQFPTGLMTRYSIIGPNAEPDKFWELVLQGGEMWDLDTPKLLLSVMGGAGGMNLSAAVEHHFCEGLVGAAKKTGGWVFTGGTDSGVMDLVGKAMHKHDSRRMVPCIGIAPFGALKEKWRQELEKDEAHGAEANIVEAPSKDDMVADKLAGLQQHHTHIVLIDSGDRGPAAFGKELDFRELLEQHICANLKGGELGIGSRRVGSLSQDFSRKRSISSSMLSGGVDILRVMVLVNGGPVSFQAMSNAIRHTCPVVVCAGSGRAADFVASLKQGRLTDYGEAWATHMTAPADKEMGIDGVKGGVDMLKEIVASPCVTVYTTEDRLEEVILSAVLQHILSKGESEALPVGLQCVLQLAMQWNCWRHHNKILSSLVKHNGVESTLTWLMRQFTTDWRELDGGLLMKSIVEVHLVDLKKLCITKLEPDELQWSGVALYPETGRRHGPPEGHLTLAFLFLWLVENKASPSVIDVIWMELDYPAHGALAAASCYREVAERLEASGGFGDAMGRQRLLDKADRFEDLAVRLLNGLDRIDPLEYLFRRTEIYGNHHLISLAHHLKCKEFVAQQFYNTAVDMLWATPTPFAVFAFDRDTERRRKNLVNMPFSDLLSLSFFMRPEAERIAVKDLFGVPRIKALTHGLFRVLFIVTYSYFVLFAEGWSYFLLQFVLFLWGISLSLVEILQYQAKSSFGEYLNLWNALDLLVLVLLLGGVLAGWTAVPLGLVAARVPAMTHSLNLLPCYLRLLQIFELSEYFGTLLFTVFGMAQDTFHFLVLLGIISLGFSCALTPIFYPTVAARRDQGVTWGFWAIFGDVDLKYSEEDMTWERHMIIGFFQYMLQLTSNVLLVNLLIAMLNDTYIANKDASKREWAFNRVDAVLEFSSPEAHILPPPLDCLVSLRALRKKGLPMSIQSADKYCKVERVVPVSSHEVEVFFEIVGDKPDAAWGSTLTWRETGNVADAGEQECSSDAADVYFETEVIGNRGKIVFREVSLTRALFFTFGITRALFFTFGKKELGYTSVPIALSEDTWRRPLTNLERRQMKLLQQQVLIDENEGDQVEEKAEAKMGNFEEKLKGCTDEMARLSEQVSQLVAVKKSEEASRGPKTPSKNSQEPSRAEACAAAENATLRAEVERLRAQLAAVQTPRLAAAPWAPEQRGAGPPCPSHECVVPQTPVESRRSSFAEMGVPGLLGALGFEEQPFPRLQDRPHSSSSSALSGDLD